MPSIREAAADEFNAALLAYKRRELMETLSASPAEGESGVGRKTGDVDRQPDEGESNNVGLVDSGVPGKSYTDKMLAFRASGTLMFPGLDRGRTLWEEDNYQSSLVTKTVPVPLGGFFSNGVAGRPFICLFLKEGTGDAQSVVSLGLEAIN